MPQLISLQNPKINNLVSRIEMGEVKIPPLQRPFVWKKEQILELLESIYHEYPIGSILWWETDKPLPSERNIAGFALPNRPEEYPFNYVLDGQQRLSSLYGVFCKDRTQAQPQEEEYNVDVKVFDVVFDLVNRKFIHADSKAEGGRYFDLKFLFDPNALAQSMIDALPEDRKTLTELYSKFSNYEVPIVITKKRDISEVGVIFERVNNTGARLDLFDLMVALTWTEEFHLQKEFKQITEILDKKNFKKIKKKIILQSLSGIIKESSSVNVITSLKGQEIRENIKKLSDSITKAVDYLSTELCVKSSLLLPHAHQIVPLTYFFSLVNTPSASQKRAINEWFWKTSFSDRYASSTDTHIDEDILSFKKLAEEHDEKAFSKLAHSLSEQELRETQFRSSNATSRAFVVLMANAHPRNLINGVLVDTGQALSGFNKREYHHIFPKNFLLQKGTPEEKINSISNFCLLPADSNKRVSDRPPSDYFENLVPQKEKTEILESNLLPVRMDLYTKDDFDEFLRIRSTKVLEYIEKKVAG